VAFLDCVVDSFDLFRHGDWATVIFAMLLKKNAMPRQFSRVRGGSVGSVLRAHSCYFGPALVQLFDRQCFARSDTGRYILRRYIVDPVCLCLQDRDDTTGNSDSGVNRQTAAAIIERLIDSRPSLIIDRVCRFCYLTVDGKAA